MSLADFSHYHEKNGTPDYKEFPAIKNANGYAIVIEHGDTLFMPSGFWHHREYIKSGFAMSLRALHPETLPKLKGAWNLFGMRGIDSMLNKTWPGC